MWTRISLQDLAIAPCNRRTISRSKPISVALRYAINRFPRDQHLSSGLPTYSKMLTSFLVKSARSCSNLYCFPDSLPFTILIGCFGFLFPKYPLNEILFVRPVELYRAIQQLPKYRVILLISTGNHREINSLESVSLNPVKGNIGKVSYVAFHESKTGLSIPITSHNSNSSTWLEQSPFSNT